MSKYLIRTILIIGGILGYMTSVLGQICMNEVSVRNWYQLADHEQEYPTWIELYNYSTETVNLSEYMLSDDRAFISKWRLPDLDLAPQKTIIIYTSGKDLGDAFRWESLVQANDEWRYFGPNREIVKTWKNLDFDDNTWYRGRGGLGYGDGDDSTIVETTYALYIRNTFEIIDKEEIKELVLHIDFDDAFIAFLNGEEIARRNVGLTGSFQPFDALPNTDSEARMYQDANAIPLEILIPDARWKSFLRDGKNVLAIQGFNQLNSSDFSLIPFLSAGVDSNEPRYRPNPTWWNKPSQALHTNFKLKGGKSVYLSTKDKIVVDSVSLQNTLPDYSQGRFPDGSPSWNLLEKGTPNASNASDKIVSCINTAPKLSLRSGFYSGKQIARLEDTPKKVKVHYTTDGSIPTQSSPVLKKKLKIDKTQVVNVRTFSKTCGPSTWNAYTYFIDEEKSLPVVSIVTPPDDLWSDERGIYVDGLHSDNSFPFYGANYWEDWEVPIFFHYFEREDTTVFEETVGLKINGGGSRAKPMKSLRVSTRSKYSDAPSLEYSFFKEKNLDSYRRILLKNAGQNFNKTHLTDVFAHRIVKDLGTLETQASQPCVVYFNGEYVGVHQMREKYGKHYLYDNFQIPADSMEIIGGVGEVQIVGENTDFQDFLEFVVYNDMTIPRNYDKVLNTFDIGNFCDFFIANIFMDNEDWRRSNNVKIWRSPLVNNNRWRYLFVDLDLTFGERSTYRNNRLDFALNNNFYHFLVFRSLLKNENFKRYFILRYFDLLNTTLDEDNLKAILKELQTEMDPAMERHFEKWSEEGSYKEWTDYYLGKRLTRFIERRPYHCLQHLQEAFELGETQRLKIDAVPKEGGIVRLNTITVDSSFVGYYPLGLKMTIVADAKPGFVFNNWEVNGDRLDSNIKLLEYNIEERNHIRAVFFRKE